MLPSSALAPEFDRRVREAGDAYAAARRVSLSAFGRDQALADVLGTSLYRVSIERRDGDDETEFRVSCSCRDFTERDEPCKHLWATLIVAERAGHLGGSGRRLTRDTAYLDVGGGRQPPTPMTKEAVAPAATGAFLANIARQLQPAPAGADTPFVFAGATLLYVIDQGASAQSHGTVLSVMEQRRSKTGGLNKPKTARLSLADIAAAPSTDRRLLALISGGVRRESHGSGLAHRSQAQIASFTLPDPLAMEVLPLIARAARLWIKAAGETAEPTPLVWDDGNAWRFELRIATRPAGFHVSGAFERDEVRVGLHEKFLTIGGGLIALRGTLARFVADASLPFLAELARSGPVDFDRTHGEELSRLLAVTGVAQADLPDELRTIEVQVAPTPRLSLVRRGDGSAGWLMASVSFDYRGTIVPAHATPGPFFDAATRRMIRRDAGEEAAALKRLGEAGLRGGWTLGPAEVELPEHRFLVTTRTLLTEGWRVEADGVRYRVARPARLSVSSGIDWFDLSAHVPFDEQLVPLTDVVSQLAPSRTMVALGDGSVGLLPEEWLSRYGTLVAAGEVRGEGVLRFRRSQTALLDALLSDRIDAAEIVVDRAFEEARAALDEATRSAPEDPSPSFTGTLRPYQREGLGWFTFLRRFTFGGCLADDMGLGKTIMVLALLDQRRQSLDEGEVRRPSLVVVPRSLVGNWLSEAQRFAPALTILDHSHALREASATSFTGHDVVLVTYGTLRRDVAALSSVEFDYAILDEAQTVKNAATISAKAVRLINARHRLALSGTPVENHLSELWSLFEFLNPGILGRSSVFQRAIASSDDVPATLSILSRGLRPFILRRTKQQVASELPARTEQTITCDLLPKDRRLYESLRRHYRTSVLEHVNRDGLAKSKMHVLEALLRLRQAACHAGLIDPKRATDESAKFDVLIPRLQEVVEEGHKALVFSQFTSLLALLRQRLDAAQLPYEYLDGKTKDRTARVNRFQTDPKVGLFLVSLKAGGLGLNLTAAEYVFLLDPWWNPAVEAQAIDRAHRIGQTSEVFAYRVIAKDTVEEKVLALQQSKRALADAVVTADAVGLRQLSREDLELLLS